MKRILTLMLINMVLLFIFSCAGQQGSPGADSPELQGAELISKYTGNQGEPIVLVHGNAGYPSHWDRTVTYLKNNGWTDTMIIRPSWGSKTCAACNSHDTTNLNVIKSALQTALSKSKTGMIDVMGHSMGVTLAAKAIIDLGYQSKVRTFVGIAGAFRGLWSCGTYPYNVISSTCGSNGLSVNSPLLNSLAGKRFGKFQYAIYSNVDEIVCSTGVCTVGGVHSSIPQVVDGTKGYSTVPYGHFGILYYSESVQTGWVKKY